MNLYRMRSATRDVLERFGRNTLYNLQQFRRFIRNGLKRKKKKEVFLGEEFAVTHVQDAEAFKTLR